MADIRAELEAMTDKLRGMGTDKPTITNKDVTPKQRIYDAKVSARRRLQRDRFHKLKLDRD